MTVLIYVLHSIVLHFYVPIHFWGGYKNAKMTKMA